MSVENFMAIVDKYEQSRKNFNWIETHETIVELKKAYDSLEGDELKEKVTKNGETAGMLFSMIVSEYIYGLLMADKHDLLKPDLNLHNNYVKVKSEAEKRIKDVKSLIGHLRQKDMSEFLSKESAEEVSDDLDELYKNLKNKLSSMQRMDTLKTNAKAAFNEFTAKVSEYFVTNSMAKETPLEEFKCKESEDVIDDLDSDLEKNTLEEDWFNVSNEQEDEKDKQQQNLPNTNNVQVVAPSIVIGSSLMPRATHYKVNKVQLEQQEQSEKDSILGNAYSYKTVISQKADQVANAVATKATDAKNTLVGTVSDVKDFFSSFINKK